MAQYSSRHLEFAIRTIAQLPGIGRKSALRIALYLLKNKNSLLPELLQSLEAIRSNIQHCQVCHNLADTDACTICADHSRQKSVICVVESERDVMAIEDTGQYHGLYHVLGGVISPIEGVGPQDLQIESLLDRIKSGDIKELIMAISPTIEGETTIFYLSKLLKDLPVRISIIARGIAFGGELEYADGVTLGRSIVARTNIELSEST
ncbi:MAG TPA: recombination mediator RecR [Saprospiraceae bacterium]|nr:recombination mediator RecR [Saprospiraceae bacterium]